MRQVKSDIHTGSTDQARLGLRNKLIRVYALQVMLISIAALIGVYITYLIVEDVLTQEALEKEASHFWERFETNRNHPLPDTANLMGYLSIAGDTKSIPGPLVDLEAGFGRVSDLPDQPLVHMSEHADARLYLVFAQAQVSDLVLVFGLAPLAAVLLTVYILLFLTYRLSHQAISPMLNLARAIERFDFRSTDQLIIPEQPANIDNETRLMIDALREFSARLEMFIERERTFTRNASHELRTPIAVLKGSIELLLQGPKLADEEITVVNRMQRVVGEMSAVLETLLMLAREEEVISAHPVSVNQVMAEEIEMLSSLAEEQHNAMHVTSSTEVLCNAKQSVLAIIISNLLRNALTFTHDGRVDIAIKEDHFSIADTGVGMSADDSDQAFTAFYRGAAADSVPSGQGLGLALVKRLCQQLGWRVAVSSVLGKGTVFTVWFGGSN